MEVTGYKTANDTIIKLTSKITLCTTSKSKQHRLEIWTNQQIQENALTKKQTLN